MVLAQPLHAPSGASAASAGRQLGCRARLLGAERLHRRRKTRRCAQSACTRLHARQSEVDSQDGTAWRRWFVELQPPLCQPSSSSSCAPASHTHPRAFTWGQTAMTSSKSKYSEGQGGLSISQRATGGRLSLPARRQQQRANQAHHSLSAGAAGASSAANCWLYAVSDLTPSAGATSLRPAGDNEGRAEQVRAGAKGGRGERHAGRDSAGGGVLAVPAAARYGATMPAAVARHDGAAAGQGHLGSGSSNTANGGCWCC